MRNSVINVVCSGPIRPIWLATAVAVSAVGVAPAEVEVLVGDPAGRVAKDPDPARMQAGRCCK